MSYSSLKSIAKKLQISESTVSRALNDYKDISKTTKELVNETVLKMGYQPFTHDKFSVSKKNVLRGIHYDNKTHKLVSVIHGTIDQVVVDLRENSKTVRKYLKFQLNGESMRSILLPPMIGNAFRVKSENAVYHYKLSYKGEYVDIDEQYTLKWNDPSVNINWMIDKPILSNRDA